MSKAKDKPAVAGKTGTPTADSKALTLNGKDEAERKTAMAGAFTSSSLNSARIVVGYNTGNTIDLMAAINALVGHQKELSAGDMSRAESMLMNQAVALQTIFVDLALRAKEQTGLTQLQTLTALALKAQSGCRATLQALGDLKYPRQATFVKQANIAHGPQQVNNGGAQKELSEQYVQAPTHGKETTPEQNKLLEAEHGQRMVIGAQGQAGRVNQAEDAVEAVHGA